MTFTFATDSGAPENVSGFGTTLLGGEDFTANVYAYNIQGQLPGSTSYQSVDDQAFVGIQDTDGEIASIFVSTSDNEFGIGTAGAAPVPEPGTLGLLVHVLSNIRRHLAIKGKDK